MLVDNEFTLREFKVWYTMCASDTLERSQQVNAQESGFITWEGSTHTYKVSLVPAGKKQNVIGTYLCLKHHVRLKKNLWTDY